MYTISAIEKSTGRRIYATNNTTFAPYAFHDHYNRPHYEVDLDDQKFMFNEDQVSAANRHFEKISFGAGADHLWIRNWTVQYVNPEVENILLSKDLT